MRAFANFMRRLRAAWRDAGRRPLCRVAAESDLDPWHDKDRELWRDFLERTGTGRRLRVRLYAHVCGEALRPEERTMHDYGRVAGMSEMLWELDHLAAVPQETGDRPKADDE